MSSLIIKSSLKFIKSRSSGKAGWKLAKNLLNKTEEVSSSIGAELLTKTRTYPLKKDKSKYLYHITSQRNYEKILESGGLKVQQGIDTKGTPRLFLFNLENALNAWANGGKRDYLAKILQMAKKNDDKLVMLRIDAKSLDVSKLKIRTLDKLFQIMKNNDINNPFLQGENSGLSYIYKQRKTLFEYMYSNDISMENISKVGDVVLNASPQYNIFCDGKAIMQSLIKNSPEKGYTFLTKT